MKTIEIPVSLLTEIGKPDVYESPEEAEVSAMLRWLNRRAAERGELIVLLDERWEEEFGEELLADIYEIRRIYSRGELKLTADERAKLICADCAMPIGQDGHGVTRGENDNVCAVCAGIRRDNDA